MTTKRTFVWIDGKEVETTDPTKLTKSQKKWCKDHGVKLAGVNRARTQATYPMVSEIAAGVHPDLRHQAMEACEAAGVPTFYNENGDPVWTDQKHRREHCKAIGLADRNCGYGGAQPDNW